MALTALQFLSHIEIGVIVLTVVLIMKVDVFAKYVTFNLADCTKVFDSQIEKNQQNPS